MPKHSKKKPEAKTAPDDQEIQVIKRSRAARLLDKTPRTLARYEALGLLTPIKVNCRSVVYRLAQVKGLMVAA